MDTKPPLGIMPRKIWEDKVKVDRLLELRRAISRCNEKNHAVPNEWKSEEKELSSALSHLDIPRS